MAEINTTELAWAAGFFDGEGCVCFSKSSYYNLAGKKLRHRIQMSVGQKNNIFPVKRFHTAIGFGNVSRPDIHFQVKWYVSTFEEVQAAIAMLWKFLCPRKKQQYIETLEKWSNRHGNMETTTTRDSS